MDSFPSLVQTNVSIVETEAIGLDPYEKVSNILIFLINFEFI